MSALVKLKEMLKLDRKTLRIEDIAPLVKDIEKMYIKTSKKAAEAHDFKVRLDLANRHILRLSEQLGSVYMNRKERKSFRKKG